MAKYRNLVGKRFGKLLVIKDVGRKGGSVLWECKCDCGRVTQVRSSHLVSGDTSSCGKSGPCHHSWGGGRDNKGSIAWATRMLHSGKSRASKRGHAPPEWNVEEVVMLWELADGRCLICSSASVLCLDHCHTTGKLRGFVCSSCNLTIGFGRDSVEVLAKCIEYLKGAA
jgi:hypothetical protein